jgi:ketosteroid isomerase-like protein
VTTQQNKEIARDFFTRFSAGDISGAVDLMSGDATWWIAGKRDSMPAAGMHTKEEITRLFLRMTRRLKNGLNMTVKSVVAEGDTVALEVESLGELDNGRSYNNEYHTLMRLEDGKIFEVREYNDTQHAYEVWLRP